MNTNKKTPKLRFKGFTDDWEQRKLGDVAIITGGGTPSTNVPEYWNGDIDWYSPVEIGKNRYVSKSTRKITKLGLEKSSAKLLPIGTVLFTSRAGIGNTAILQAEGCTNQGFQSITPDSKELDTYFLYTMTPRLKRYGEVTGAGSTFVEVSGKQMEKMSLVLPSLEEQKQIGRFFRTIDDSITLHQRKLEKLKLNKSALLQKLFPQKGCTIPDVRFKGFTDAWEQRKLGDVAIITGGGTPSTNVPEYWNGDIDWYSPVEIGKNRYVSKSTRKITKLGLEKSSAKLLPIGTVLFTSRAGIGNTAILQAEGCTNQGFQSITPDSKELDTYFLYTMTPRLKRYGEVTGAGSTFVEVSGKQMEKMSLVLPSLEEQKQIGRFFRTIDDSITLHQRKLEKLKLNKSALLQKLFPQKGCTIPDVRFKGFTDAWEQRKLNDFGIATGGTSIESEFVDGGTYKVINIGSYSEESVYNDQGLRVNKTDKTKSRILNKYDLTMILNDKTASGNIIGRVLLIDQDNTYVYNQRTERIEVDTKNFLPMFLYHMLNAPEQRKYIVKASQGNTQIYVNWSTISNIDYMIPQLLLEQEKIANLFSLINKDITLHQRKLDCLISIKKGLLQQLFV